MNRSFSSQQIPPLRLFSSSPRDAIRDILYGDGYPTLPSPTTIAFGGVCLDSSCKLPGLSVSPYGPVGLPLTPSLADVLAKACPSSSASSSAAAGGLPYSFPASCVKLINPQWSKCLSSIVSAAVAGIGVDKKNQTSVVARLHSLQLHLPGGSSPPGSRGFLRSSPAPPRAFATLLVFLPSSYEVDRSVGSELSVHHGTESRAYSFAPSAAFDVHYALFFDSVERVEAAPLVSGSRLVLLYDVVHEGTTSYTGPVPCMASFAEPVKALGLLVAKWAADFNAAGDKIVVNVDNLNSVEALLKEAVAAGFDIEGQRGSIDCTEIGIARDKNYSKNNRYECEPNLVWEETRRRKFGLILNTLGKVNVDEDTDLGEFKFIIDKDDLLDTDDEDEDDDDDDDDGTTSATRSSLEVPCIAIWPRSKSWLIRLDGDLKALAKLAEDAIKSDGEHGGVDAGEKVRALVSAILAADNKKSPSASVVVVVSEAADAALVVQTAVAALCSAADLPSATKLIGLLSSHNSKSLFYAPVLEALQPLLDVFELDDTLRHLVATAPVTVAITVASFVAASSGSKRCGAALFDELAGHILDRCSPVDALAREDKLAITAFLLSLPVERTKTWIAALANDAKTLTGVGIAKSCLQFGFAALAPSLVSASSSLLRESALSVYEVVAGVFKVVALIAELEAASNSSGQRLLCKKLVRACWHELVNASWAALDKAHIATLRSVLLLTAKYELDGDDSDDESWSSSLPPSPSPYSVVFGDGPLGFSVMRGSDPDCVELLNVSDVALVSRVHAGSAADNRVVSFGSVVVSLNGTAVSCYDDFLAQLATKERPVTITFRVPPVEASGLAHLVAKLRFLPSKSLAALVSVGNDLVTAKAAAALFRLSSYAAIRMEVEVAALVDTPPNWNVADFVGSADVEACTTSYGLIHFPTWLRNPCSEVFEIDGILDPNFFLIEKALSSTVLRVERAASKSTDRRRKSIT